MRTVFLTGPGGAGRTTVAAATAVRAARHGTATLLISADPIDTAGGAFGTATGPAPVSPLPGLTVLRPDAAAGFRAGLLALQRRAVPLLDLLGAAPLADDELTALPGSTELAVLGALRSAANGPYDLLVVDLPAGPGGLATLALPAQLRRYLSRLLPPQRQAARALRPVLGQLVGVPIPAPGWYEAAEHWDTELAGLQGMIEDSGTTVWLVAEPGEAGTEAVRTTAAGVALYGLRMDALIANRMLPAGSVDPWLADLAARQRKTVGEWDAACGAQGGAEVAAPVYEVGHLGRAPHGLDDLAALAGVPESGPGPGACTVAWPVADRRAEDGVLVWQIPLPGARRAELDLVRRGDALIVTVGPFRRVVALPAALRRCSVDGAGLREGCLRVRFRPDAGLWPRSR